MAVTIPSIVIADMTHAVGILKVLNNYAPLIQAVASVIAVIVTAVLVWITLRYARSTHKMQKIMEKQILAEIKLDALCLRTNIRGLGGYIAGMEPDIKCMVSFDIYNKNSGSGSIKKPELFLRSRNNDFELRIPMYIRTGDDEQKSIFLQGGEYRPVELSYKRVISGDTNRGIRENISNLNSLEWCIKYRDNLGKDYKLLIEKIIDENSPF